MTIRRFDLRTVSLASTLSGATRIGYLCFVAWSSSRGPRSLQTFLAVLLQQAAVLAIGFCFPVSHARRPVVGWKMQPVVIPAAAGSRGS